MTCRQCTAHIGWQFDPIDAQAVSPLSSPGYPHSDDASQFSYGDSFSEDDSSLGDTRSPSQASLNVPSSGRTSAAIATGASSAAQPHDTDSIPPRDPLHDPADPTAGTTNTAFAADATTDDDAGGPRRFWALRVAAIQAEIREAGPVEDDLRALGLESRVRGMQTMAAAATAELALRESEALVGDDGSEGLAGSDASDA